MEDANLQQWLRDSTDRFNTIPQLRHDSNHTTSSFTADFVVFTVFRVEADTTANLPTPDAVPNFSGYFKNIGASVATLSAGTYFIDGSNSTTLSQYDSLQLYSDGTQYWVI